MGLLNDLFGTEELKKLRGDLAACEAQSQAKSRQIAALTSEVGVLQTTNQTCLSERARQAQRANLLQEAFDDLRNKPQAEQALLQYSVSALEASVRELTFSRDQAVNSFEELQAATVDQTQLYEERERKLAEKSDKLQQERQKFQQQAQHLHIREQHWKVHIEPKLRAYEEYQALDVRKRQVDELLEALSAKERALAALDQDLTERNCTGSELAEREAAIKEREELLREKEDATEVRELSLDQRARSLEALEASLSAFRERVDNIDAEREEIRMRAEKLALKEEVAKENHKVRLAEVRKQRAELRRDVEWLDERDADLRARSRVLKRQEKNMQAIRDENLQLKQDIDQCAKEKRHLSIEFADFKRRCEHLRNPELQIRSYDPRSDSGKITRPALNLRAQSVLTAHHYHVGMSGIHDAEKRRNVLRALIGMPFHKLTKVGPPEYMRQWGEARTMRRVRCVAFHLSWDIGFQGAKETNELARQHWLDDLNWLSSNYKGDIPNSEWPNVPEE